MRLKCCKLYENLPVQTKMAILSERLIVLAMLMQGPVNLDYVVWNSKGSMSCTDIPFNDSSVIIIYHLLAISNGLIICLVSVLYYHLPVDADNQYRSNPGQVGLGSSRPESTRPGQLGRVKSALYIYIRL